MTTHIGMAHAPKSATMPTFVSLTENTASLVHSRISAAVTRSTPAHKSNENGAVEIRRSMQLADFWAVVCRAGGNEQHNDQQMQGFVRVRVFVFVCACVCAKGRFHSCSNCEVQQTYFLPPLQTMCLLC